MNEKGLEKNAAHKAHADKYRATPWHSKPAPGTPEPLSEDFPMHVHCADGVSRMANNAEEQAALEAIPQAVDPSDPPPPIEDPSGQTQDPQQGNGFRQMLARMRENKQQ